MKKLTTRLIAVVACAAFALTVAVAAPDEKKPDPETAAAVKDLMTTLKVQEQMGPVLSGIKQMQMAMLDQQQLSDDEKKAARELMSASMDEVESVLDWKNLEGVMVRAYASVFTTEEVKALNEMFLTPAGQTFVEKQPELQAATMGEMQTIMAELMPRIQKKTQEAIERIKNQATPQN